MIYFKDQPIERVRIYKYLGTNIVKNDCLRSTNQNQRN